MFYLQFSKSNSHKIQKISDFSLAKSQNSIASKIHSLNLSNSLLWNSNVLYTEAIDIPQLIRNEVDCAIVTMVRVKRFYKTVFFFQILHNTLNFILLFWRLNSFIIQLLISVVDYFWIFQFFREFIGFFFGKAYVYFFSRPSFLQFFIYCCYSCRILSKIRRSVCVFKNVNTSRNEIEKRKFNKN